MWIDFLLCMLMVIGAAILSVYLYRLGLRDGRDPLAVFLPMINSADKPVKEDPEIERMNSIIRNIDNYDGTDKGQVKIDG